ncbi:MAG: hypothetical protein CVU50_01950 [Candidatus Cloacimonetes bacterium HGW-Cloacimonetes-3]|nr:MAG: hypothetical protein CVU50_01950 [Candidatus Cloacimonetes bacterium HGW-Cloacimonetes-3]
MRWIKKEELTKRKRGKRRLTKREKKANIEEKREEKANIEEKRERGKRTGFQPANHVTLEVQSALRFSYICK